MSKKKSVAVLDDDEGILEVLSVVLEDAEYDVAAFSDHEDFKAHLIRSQVDVILMDIFIGGVDGVALCQELKNSEFRERPPVILMSADNKVREMSRRAGADDFLTKPFDIAELVTIVEKHAA